MHTQTVYFRNPLAQDLDRLMANMLTPRERGVPTPAEAVESYDAATSVWSDAKSFVIELDVPGFKMEQVDVTSLGRELTIVGRRDTSPPEGAHVHAHGRIGGSFRRVVRLPQTIQTEQITASIRDGVLQVIVPKAELVQPRKIAVTGPGNATSATTSHASSHSSGPTEN